MTVSMRGPDGSSDSIPITMPAKHPAEQTTALCTIIIERSSLIFCLGGGPEPGRAVAVCSDLSDTVAG